MISLKLISTDSTLRILGEQSGTTRIIRYVRVAETSQPVKLKWFRAEMARRLSLSLPHPEERGRDSPTAVARSDFRALADAFPQERLQSGGAIVETATCLRTDGPAAVLSVSWQAETAHRRAPLRADFARATTVSALASRGRRARRWERISRPVRWHVDPLRGRWSERDGRMRGFHTFRVRLAHRRALESPPAVPGPVGRGLGPALHTRTLTHAAPGRRISRFHLGAEGRKARLPAEELISRRRPSLEDSALSSSYQGFLAFDSPP